jgi:hypothetical protein
MGEYHQCAQGLLEPVNQHIHAHDDYGVDTILIFFVNESEPKVRIKRGGLLYGAIAPMLVVLWALFFVLDFHAYTSYVLDNLLLHIAVFNTTILVTLCALRVGRSALAK